MFMGQDNATIHRHFVQKKTELGETFQRACGNYLLDKEIVNSLGAIICGDATIDYLILGDAAPVAEQYAASIYHRIQAQQPVWPFTNKKQCLDAQNARECYSAAYEAYAQHQTPLTLLSFYKDQYLIGRAYLAVVAAYLTREEKNKKEREKERPHWKIFWQDLQKKQKHAVQLSDSEFTSFLATQKMYHALIRGYTEIKTSGKTARDILETKFYGLACSQAKKFQRDECTMEELVDEAMIGIHTAVDRYDYKRGILFGTYARYWTKARLQRFTEQRGQGPAHFGREIQEAVNVLELLERDLRQKLGCEPTDTLLLERFMELGYTEERAKEALGAIRLQSMPLDQESEDGSFVNDFIPDPSEKDLSEEIFRRCVVQDMRHALVFLEQRERMVLELRYRMNDFMPKHDKKTPDLMPLDDIAKILAAQDGIEKPLCHERIRQIEKTAFTRLGEILRRPEFAYVQAALEHE